MDRLENTFTVQDYYNLIVPDLEKIKETIGKIGKYYNRIDDKGDISTLKTRIGLMVQETEKLALIGRSIPVFQQQETFVIDEESGIDIQIEKKEEAMILKLPLLLPKARSTKTNKAYLVSMFYKTFQEQLRGMQKYDENVIIWFEFQYKKRAGKKTYRDHDNIETKIVKDLLVPFVVVDDSPLYCDDFHSSRTGDGDATYIHIVPRRSFGEYYQGRVYDYEET